MGSSLRNIMHWVIQEKVIEEGAFHLILSTLTRGGIPYSVVKFIPFTHKLIPTDADLSLEDIPEIVVPDGNVFVMGATLMNLVAKEKGWNPGTFHNENHSYDKWLEHWGDNLLNNVSRVGKLGILEVPWKGKDIFIRPCHDTKAFNGQLMNESEFDLWRKDQLSSGRDPMWLGPDTDIVVAPYKEIFAEYRFFVVDGEIVTGSLYKLGHRLCPDEYVAPAAKDYAKAMIDIWAPARGFVIDIAETSEGYRVIEVNTLNSSGFYKCDVSKIIGAVEAMSLEGNHDRI